MFPNPFNHVDLRVADIDEALRFYAALLPRLGFTRERHGGGWKVFAAGDRSPSTPYFGFTEEAGHRPDATRIAFWAGSELEVDRLAEVVRTAGGRNVSGPKACPEYSPTYYAVFFDDPSGNHLEICFRED